MSLTYVWHPPGCGESAARSPLPVSEGSRLHTRESSEPTRVLHGAFMGEQSLPGSGVKEGSGS